MGKTGIGRMDPRARREKKCKKNLAKCVKEFGLHPMDRKVSPQLFGEKNDIKVTHSSKPSERNWKTREM